MTITKFNITKQPRFINSKKELATYFIKKFKFNSEDLEKLEQIKDKGYYIDNGVCKTLFATGKLKRNISFANL